MTFDLEGYFAAREQARLIFCQTHGYGEPALIREDMASRRFYRTSDEKGGRAILMDSLPDHHPHATIGHKISDVVGLSDTMRKAGVHTPDIYAADIDNGFVLMEDFGDLTYEQALFTADDTAPLYDAAIETLMKLNGAHESNKANRPLYQNSRIHYNRRRIIDWYLPSIKERQNPDGLADAFLTIWDKVEETLPPCPQGLLHSDFHRGNLMWLANEKGAARCGVLDYQDAHWGPIPYDLVNLLEDGRARVPGEIKIMMKERYCAAMDAEARAVFDQWYLLLSAQFHCRVIGQFIKLALVHNKSRYLDYVPVAQDYLRVELAQPLLKPVAEWLYDQGLTLEGPVRPDPALIRADAV